MSKNDKQDPFVPRLRFPEFRNAPQWEVIPLGQLLARDPQYGVNESAVPFSEELPAYLRITDIDDDGRYMPDGRVSVEIDPTKDQYLEEGDIVLARTGASVGKSYRYRPEDGRLVFAGFLIRIRPNPATLDSRYLAAYFTTGQYWDWVGVTSARSGQPGINGTEYASMSLPVPPDRDPQGEQRRIADCLGSLDDVIVAEGRKLAALRDHKQGLMQQLFPREGKSQPLLRFPEFRDAGDWEPTIIDELATIQSGGTPSKSNPDYWGGTIPWVSAKDMKNVRLIDTEDHVTDVAAADGAKEVPAGTVLMLTRGMTLLKDVPICLLQRPMTYNQDVKALRPRKGVVSEFLAYLLLASKPSLRALVDIAGHGTGRLSTDELKKLELSKPTPAEQHRIADCLSALDVQIAGQAARHDALRTYKRGLMQQLFPLASRESAAT
jgi:type I restriction enzyme S subunit